MARKGTRRGFGHLRRLPSKRWQASYIGPDGARHKAPHTFTAKMDGEAWLAAERALVERPDWRAPDQRDDAPLPTLREYADHWLARRELRPRTVILYRGLLDRHVLPTLGAVPLDGITSPQVRGWFDNLETGPTARAQAYSLLRTILGTAVDDQLLSRNPCTLRNAGRKPRMHHVEVMTPQQIAVATSVMPQRLQALLLVTAWCGLRLGEALELRRGDVDRLPNGTFVVKVRRAVSRVKGAWLVGPPKTAHGVRDVAVPPHVSEVLARHLAEYTPQRDDALLWPSPRDPDTYLQRSTLNLSWRPAAEAAGVPGMRWHDLRHTGATLAAQAGATVPELMARIGHSTPAAALRYQHAAQGRDAQIAGALSRLVEGGGEADLS
ncbi:tyrosine-type recombinase/integrase [Kytococcus sedentarius]|uniref:tyrosine-type recombinase/integrase n=1 Tax=Kytococcus sedentarius TaxID=1276 RepID=UPI0035BBFDE3